MSHLPASTTDANLEPAGFGKTLRTVLFGLLGVAGNQKDLADGQRQVSPLRLLIFAVIFMLFFVGSLVTLATSIAAK